SRGRRRLCPADATRLDGAPGAGRRRAPAPGRHRDHDRADPGTTRPEARQRRDGRQHEARLGDPRHGGRARRQLRTLRSRPDRGGQPRDHHRHPEPAGHGAGRLLRALRAQRPRLPQARHRQGRRVRDRPRGRHRPGLPRRPRRQGPARKLAPYRSTGTGTMEAISHTVINLIIFVLAIYVGYHVVWNVTPALHTPLMAVTNAISAIIIVGAMLAAALTESGLGKAMGVLAVALAAVNVFGGFLVTRRMLEMFKKKSPAKGGKPESASCPPADPPA